MGIRQSRHKRQFQTESLPFLDLYDDLLMGGVALLRGDFLRAVQEWRQRLGVDRGVVVVARIGSQEERIDGLHLRLVHVVRHVHHALHALLTQVGVKVLVGEAPTGL